MPPFDMSLVQRGARVRLRVLVANLHEAARQALVQPLGRRLLQPEQGAYVIVLVFPPRTPGRVPAFELGVAIPHLCRALQVFLRLHHVPLRKFRLYIDS